MKYAACLLATGFCLAQSTLGRVEGRVLMAASDAPVPHALVSLRLASLGSRPLLVSTDSSGRFTADRLTPGSYSLSAKAPGMVDGSFSVAQLSIAPGAAISGILLRLTPQGVLTGRVLDEANRPVPGLRVTAVPPPPASSGGVEAETDDQGRYTLTGLRPGAYLVMANLPDSLSRTLNSPSPSLATRSGLAAATYYPSAPSREEADLARVQAGAVTSGIDIAVRSSAFVTVSGRLDPALSPSRYSYVSLHSLHSSSLAFGLTLAGDGAFSFRGIPRGDYWLQSQTAQGELGSSLFVSVVDQDISDLVLAGPARFSLPGRIVNQGSRVDFTRLQVSLMATISNPRSYNTSAAVSAEGAFALSVPPGLYRVNVFGEGAPDHYIKAATLNGRDVLHSGIVADRNMAGDLSLTFASDGGRVEGAVELGAASPREIAILLWPTGSRRQELHRCLRASADPSGRFDLRGIAPGEYFIAALHPAPAGGPNLQYPASWYQVFEDRALRLQVNANSRQTVNLKPFDPR